MAEALRAVSPKILKKFGNLKFLFARFWAGRQVERARRTLRDFRKAVHASGATMARTRGLSYHEEVREVPGSDSSQLMKRIKGAIDPNRIMNPGNIFD